jgi:hypothetical protein
MRWFPLGLDRVAGPRPGGEWDGTSDPAVVGEAEGGGASPADQGEKQLVDVCCEHDLKQSEVEGWMDTFVNAGERGLKANAEDEAALHEKELKELRAKVGELVLELDARKKWAALNGRDETAF